MGKRRSVASGTDSRSPVSTSKPTPQPPTPSDYRILIEALPQWVWMAKPDGNITYCNRYWHEFSGLDAEQTLSNGWISLLHPEDKPLAAQIWQNALASGSGFTSEFRYRRAGDGQYRWHLTRGLPLKDANGQVVKWVGFGFDVHDSKIAKNELADREGRLRAILETEPECIKLLSADGSLLEMNPAGLAMVEADSAKQVIGRSLSELVDPPYRAAVRDLTRRVFRGEADALEYEITGLKGAHRWLHTKATPLRDSNGFIWALLGVTRDITQQKKVEQELRAGEARFRALIEHSNDNIVLFDLEGKIEFCSNSVERVLGYHPDELLGRHFFDLLHPDDRVRIEGDMERVFEQRGHSRTIRSRALRKDGTWRILEGFVTNLLHDPSVRSIVSNLRDITDKVWAEEALIGSEERFAKAFRSSPLPIIITTRAEGRYLDVNEAMVELTGYSREQMIGRTVKDLGLWAEPEHRDAFIGALLNSGRVAGFQARFRTRVGEVREVELFAEQIELGGTACILAITRDITEAKKLEAQFRQAQKMEAVGRLAGGVAHDFNNMLAVIVGYSQILEDHLAASDPGQKHVEQIKKAAERASGLTRQLLAFSRQQVLQPRVLNLNSVVKNLARMLRRMIGEDIVLAFQPSAALGSVTADLGQMEQILMNLAVNARDAMPHGGRITIETADVYLEEDHAQHHPTVRAGHYVMLSMTDTGAGMDEQTLSRIFEPFFTTKGAGKGTGLGLSMVYGIVKQSEGYIWANSRLGEGATFRIYFPRVEALADPLTAEKLDMPAMRGSETVLVVEDDESLRTLVVDLLGESGYRVLEATNVQAALEIARDNDFIQLLLTDVIMPTMSGSELASRLVAMRPGLKVLYMSGYSGDLIASHGVLEQETSLLEKPFTKHGLLGKVRSVLDKDLPQPAPGTSQ